MSLETPFAPGQPRWLLVLTLLLGATTVVLGGVGLFEDPRFAEAVRQDGAFASWAKLVLEAVALLALDAPADGPANLPFSIARLTAVAFALAAVSTIVLSLSRTLSARLERTWIGASSYLRPRRSHSVVCGLGGIGVQVVRDLRQKDGSARGDAVPRRPVIVLERDAANLNVDEARRLGAVVLFGDAREHQMRRRARLHLARELFIACGDDPLNIDVAGDLLRDFTSGRLRRPRRFLAQERQLDRHLQCYVHTGDPEFSHVFRDHEMFQANDDVVDFHAFNVREHAAHELLLHARHGLARRYAPAAHEVAHYVLFGFGKTAQTVALHMGRLAHFSNCRRLRMTVIDDFRDDAPTRKARDSFLDRHPGFCPDSSFTMDDDRWRCDPDRDAWRYRGARPAVQEWQFPDAQVVEYAVNAEFLDMPTEVDAPELLARLSRRLVHAQDPPVKAGVVMCFDDDRRNFQAALRLRDALRRLPRKAAPAVPMPIYAYLSTETGLPSVLDYRSEPEQAFPLHAFGQLERSASYPRVVRPFLKELAARLHVAYGEIQTPGRAGRSPEPSRVGLEESAPPPALDLIALYSALPPAYRSSNEDAAAHADVKLDSVGYRRRRRTAHEEEPTVSFTPEQAQRLSEMEHNRWMAERLVAGWRSGPRDDQRRRRPSFRAWEALPDRVERAKDESQVRALVRALHMAGEVLESDDVVRSTESSA